MTFETIAVNVKDQVAIVTHNRPQTRNASVSYFLARKYRPDLESRGSKS